MNSGRLGWVMLGVGVCLAAATLLVGAYSGHLAESARGMPQIAAYLATTFVLVTRRPEHRVTHRLTWFALLLTVGFAVGTGLSAYLAGRPTPSWAVVPVLGLLVVSAAQWVLMLAVCAVFPDGEYHARFEIATVRAAAILVPVAAAVAVLSASRLTYPGPEVWGSGVSATNPLAARSLQRLGAVASGVLQAGVLLLAAGVVLLALRYRRFDGVRRQQAAWPLYAFALTVASSIVLGALGGSVTSLPDWARYLLYLPVVLMVPAGLLVGMLRHRLFDVDLVIRRSVVYGSLWLVITVGYIAAATAFGVAVGQRVPLQLAIALTIAASLIASPIRRRLERIADRLVFGRRLSGYELISRLGTRLESGPTTEDVAATVADSVQTGLAARWTRVILDRPTPRTVAAAGIGHGGDSAATLRVPLVHGRDTVGAIECGPRREGRYNASEQQLLQTLGRQAALAIRNSQLATELSERLGELDASRTRLVHAEEAGRRRLERDIHDGVQQELAALLARLGLARNQLRRDPALAATTLRDVQDDGRRALESLQELARGIHPALLTDRGVLEAVQERAARLPIPVEVSADGLVGGRRFPADIEGAAYFFCSEALANVLKHAGAGRVWIRFESAPDRLCVEVTDDGRGFSAPQVERHGLRGLQDRIEALGGCLEIIAAEGDGTTLRAGLPTGEVTDG